MDSIRILIADDHALVRSGIRALLGKLPDIRVVAEARDGREALRQVARYRPQVVLMDIAMPGLNGLEATRSLAKSNADVHVIILSMHSEEEYVVQALRARAKGYLLKGASISELELAIKTVANGQLYLSAQVSPSALVSYVQRTNGELSPLEKLTPRQREILQLIAEGKTTKQIALVLNVSVKTIEAHRVKLMRRLGIHNIPTLVRYAARTGLVNLEVLLPKFMAISPPD